MPNPYHLLTPADFITNSLKENLAAAESCLSYRKVDHEEWGVTAQDNSSPALGIPAAILLVSIIDSLGSVVRNKSVTVDRTNFYVLGHEMFGNLLDRAKADAVYDDLRSLLVHNGMLRPNLQLSLEQEGHAFSFGQKGKKYSLTFVRLPVLLELCRRAIDYFIERRDLLLTNNADSYLLDIVTRAVPVNLTPTQDWTVTANTNNLVAKPMELRLKYKKDEGKSE